METSNEQMLPQIKSRVKQLNKDFRWLRLWNWVGWNPLVAALQLLGLILALVIVDGYALSAWGILCLIRGGLTGFYEWDEEQEDLINKLPVCLAANIMALSFFGLLFLGVGLFWVLL